MSINYLAIMCTAKSHNSPFTKPLTKSIFFEMNRDIAIAAALIYLNLYIYKCQYVRIKGLTNL